MLSKSSFCHDSVHMAELYNGKSLGNNYEHNQTPLMCNKLDDGYSARHHM